MSEVAEGSVVDGRYRLLRRIGSGGMADVWLAEDPHLQRQVALKILHRRFAQDRQFVERFQREAEAAANLQHPNIVAVYDRGEHEGAYYIAMQYLPGRTLKEAIDSGLTVPEAGRLIRQVLEAAGFAHRHGVVHRDLKPQNVIVDADGKATVTDFGIARAGASEITQEGSVMGTPHYLSPEQAQGFDTTPVSDVYSVGVMLYEALTRRLPFQGDSAVAIAMKQVSHTPQRPSAVNPEVSPALDAVVMRALEKDPGRRFQSAEAFGAALDAALEGRGADFSGTAPFEPVPAVTAPTVPTETAAGEAEERHRRRRRGLLVLLAVLVGLLIGALIAYGQTRDTTTRVPKVTGDQLSVAIALLEQNGFTVGQVSRVRREVTRNTVLEQDPAASPPAEPAELDCAFLGFFCSKPRVTLTVSAGPGSAKVPGVAGRPQAEAVKVLEEAGFDPEVRRANSAKVEKGTVVYSTPSAGTRARLGSTVVLTVSRGPHPARVPVLVGTRRNVAVQQLRGRGLVPEVVEEESSSPAGEVIRQQPSAGALLDPGSTVTIVVSAGREAVEVPKLVGRERSEAVEAVRAVGLEAAVTEEATEDEAEWGRVVEQYPPAGSEVEPGSSVTVVVGRRPPIGSLEEGESETEAP